MKKFLALAVLASSALSYASDRAIYDIMYLPTAGTSYGFSEFEHLSSETKGRAGNADIEVEGWDFVQTIGHSFTDRLSVQADLGYGDFTIDEEGEPKADQKGFGDPAVVGKFRVMDEAFRFDILAGMKFGIQDSEITTSEDRDNHQGGHSATLGGQLGFKNEFFQWSFLAQYFYNMERTVEVFNKDIDYDPNNEIKLRADMLNKLGEVSYLRSFLSADFAEAVDGGSSRLRELFSPATVYTLGAEYQHLFSANLLGRLGLDYASTYTDSGDYKADEAWNLRIAANYQF